MIRRAIAFLALGSLLGVLGSILPMAATAAPSAPFWKLSISSQPTHLKPGSSDGQYLLVATNVGGAPTSGPITISDTLPAGIIPKSVNANGTNGTIPDPACVLATPVVTCTTAGPVAPGLSVYARIIVEVGAGLDGSKVTNQFEVSGGGAPATTASTETTVSSTPAAFALLDGEAAFSAPFSGSDGSAVTQAGSHPYQLMVDLSLSTVRPGPSTLTSAGHPHSVVVDLPRGVVLDPAAVPVRCAEVQLTSETCPRASQVGVVTVTTDGGQPEPASSPLYNMVPPPGSPGSLGFDAAGIGIFVHLIGSLRSDGDYGLSGSANDILALGPNPIMGSRVELWGDPSSPSHDNARSGGAGNPPVVEKCLTSGGLCPVQPQNTAALTLPSDCPGPPSTTRIRIDSWEAPGVFKEAAYASADLEGNPTPTAGCDQLDFEPEIEVQPTTALADSPSGLDVELHQPQNQELEREGVEQLSPAILKDATVTLPEGFVANAAQADGLAACSSEQIGLTTPVGQTPIHFSKVPASCPDAAKLGTVEVASPLLAQYDEENKVMRDAEGRVIPEPLRGSVYLAKPFDNPFGSLLAIYFSIADAKTGIVAKFAGEVEPDPITGQLTTRFEENPELPIEDVRVHLFSADRAPLITPPTCGLHTTTAQLTPWSSPEGADAQISDSFTTTTAPGGGACPATPAQAPHAPAFTAGTISPQAGAYSPLALNLSRSDGSQRLTKIDTTLPPGLAAKLAGVSYCPEAGIAAAQARGNPNEGALEQASPSCPAASEIGVVDVGAGAGSAPFHVQGRAYLAGPYKGAPLSIMVITPAIAGPFDLGVVVVRTAVYIEPETAQARAVSDPFPSILHGIPVNVRSVAVKMARPEFTLNPTSCDPMQVVGTATSLLGQLAPLVSPFQVGGCANLGFKPTISLRLKGGIKRGKHPALRAVVTYPEGAYANVARAQVTLPRSAFLENSHIRTICTRVQFAADQCPPGSVYGYARAFTPLLDQPLEGPVYLRSSSNELPDIVADLNGQINVVLDGRIDSINGGIRSSFEAVPDAPVSKFVLTMQGGRKGLLVNSRNICSSVNRATVKLDGQNGKVHDFRPAVRANCGKKKGQRSRRQHR